MTVVEYRGWPNNLRLANDTCELIVTLDVGPRVIAYRFHDGFNVMKNYDEMMGGTNEPEWQIRGGHRFWLAPEDLTRTYFPDNRPVTWTNDNGTAVITAPPETEYGVQKVMKLKLHPTGTKVDVTLTVTNVGPADTTLAPWGPTVMAPGGVEIIPLPRQSPPPRPRQQRQTPGRLRPESGNRLLALLRLHRHEMDLRQPVHPPPPGRHQRPHQNRPRAPRRLGRLPQLPHPLRQTLRLPPRGHVPRPRHQIPDLQQRRHAGNGNRRRTGDAQTGGFGVAR